MAGRILSARRALVCAGGFDFNQETRPTYSDFAYFASQSGCPSLSLRSNQQTPTPVGRPCGTLFCPMGLGRF
jgi:hypothetical protein